MTEATEQRESTPAAGPAAGLAAGPGAATGPGAPVGRPPTPLAAEAVRLDQDDPLAALRARFVLDTVSGEHTAVYLDGNSLGALPRAVPDRLAEVVGHQWGRLRVESWRESGWWEAPERIGELIAPLLGAGPGQVVVGDSTSVNVFKAVVGAVRLAQGRARPSGAAPRDEVLVDATTFPTDGYVAESAARMTGCALRAVAPESLAEEAGARTAVALVNQVDYRTGELRDLPGITAALHRVGAVAVWDLCHSAGALSIGLDRHQVDFAVGCTYKYLNGGPGAPAYLYIRREHQPSFDSPLPGWTSHAEPFRMTRRYTPADGVARGRVGTPDILSMLALEAALEVWHDVDLEAVRAKSLALTDFFLRCVEAYLPSDRVWPLTPRDHARRGSQIALRCPDPAPVMERLIERGIVGDVRLPDALRFGFTPLYTSFADTERAARVLGEVLT